MNLFRSLHHRPFALLWSGQAISRVGDHLYQIALVWWVLEKTGSATAMGAVLIFSFAPMLLFLLIGGVAVDRFPRVRVMLLSDLARGIVVSVVAILAWTQRLEIGHVYLASLLFGFVDAFFQPAYTAAVPELTPTEDLPSANSLTSLSQQLGRIVGPLLGAALVAWGGTSAAFALNGLSFFISMLCLAPLLSINTSSSASASESSSVLNDLREGIGTVLAEPWLWISIAVFALSNVTLAGPYSIALPFLVKDNLHADVSVLGWLYAAFPAGYVIGSVWLGRKTRIRRRGLMAYGGLITAGLMMLALGLPVPIAGLLLAAFVNGAALEVGGLIWTNTLQELVPRERLGRVASIDALGSFALLPIGYGLVGWATEQFGAPLVIVLGGALTVVLAILGLTHPAVRGLD